MVIQTWTMLICRHLKSKWAETWRKQDNNCNGWTHLFLHLCEHIYCKNNRNSKNTQTDRRTDKEGWIEKDGKRILEMTIALDSRSTTVNMYRLYSTTKLEQGLFTWEWNLSVRLRFLATLSVNFASRLWLTTYPVYIDLAHHTLCIFNHSIECYSSVATLGSAQTAS